MTAPRSDLKLYVGLIDTYLDDVLKDPYFIQNCNSLLGLPSVYLSYGLCMAFEENYRLQFYTRRNAHEEAGNFRRFMRILSETEHWPFEWDPNTTVGYEHRVQFLKLVINRSAEVKASGEAFYFTYNELARWFKDYVMGTTGFSNKLVRTSPNKFIKSRRDQIKEYLI